MLSTEKQLQIISFIKTNNELVLKELYVNNFRKVELFVLKNNGSSQQAKDIYQETFISVWKNIREDKFVPANETALEGYIYQIAKNKWIDYLRSVAYKKTESLNAHYSLNESEENAIDYLEENRKTDKAMAAFKNLGQACKDLLSSFYLKKTPLRAIAEELNIDEASARNKKYRCLQKLREIASAP